MAENKTLKNQKTPTQSYIGQHMDSVVDRLKMHKSHKNVNEALGEMGSVISGANLQAIDSGIIKKAYLAGLKYASDSVSENTEIIEEQDSVINQLRRGWPDPSLDEKEAEKEKGHEVNTAYDESRISDRAKLTRHSPDVTV